jgi:acyl-CoA synthetase (NDP forming)
MVGSDEAFNLMCAAYGVVAVDDIRSFIDAVCLASATRSTAGGGVAVLTSSGGAGALTADHLDAVGLRLADLGSGTRALVSDQIPPFGSSANPVDVTAQLFDGKTDALGAVIDALGADDDVAALIVVLTQVVGDIAERVATVIADYAREPDAKPLCVVWLAAESQIEAARATLVGARVPLLHDVSDAARALHGRIGVSTAHPRRRGLTLADQGGAVASFDAAVGRAQARASNAVSVLTESAGAPILDAIGVGRPRGQLAVDSQAAQRAAAQLGDPVVMKVQAPEIVHKTDVGAVRIGVRAAEASTVFDELMAVVARTAPDARIDGVAVQELVPTGIELIVGLHRLDPSYPATLTVGAGGREAELYGDAVTALAPVSTPEASDLLDRLRLAPRLRGYRGEAGYDRAAAARAIARLSQLADALGDRLVELEVNPLIVHRTGATAVDFLLRFRERHVS